MLDQIIFLPVNTSSFNVTRGYSTYENITFCIRSMKCISILHAKQTYFFYQCKTTRLPACETLF
jgi:hypothetical protein